MNLKTSLLNSLLRAITLASKLFLLVYLAKRLLPEEIGLWGIFSASVNYALYFIGLDFYTYANREIIGQSKVCWPAIIRDQSLFYLFSYIIAIPILSSIFIYKIIDWQYFKWFFLILTLEHLSQETTRLLIALQYPLHATMVLFMRSGAWVYAVIIIMVTIPESRTLITVFAGWSIGVGSGLIIAIIILSNLDWRQAFSSPPNWKWIIRGIETSIPFFIGTLALRGTYTLDKFFLKFNWGEMYVGIYSFYLSITTSLQYLIDAAVLFIYFPKVISFYKNDQLDSYRSYLRKMSYQICILVSLFIFALGLLIWPMLSYINKASYNEHIGVFWLLLLSNGLIALASSAHLSLYSIGQDRIILTANLLSFFISLIAFSIFIPIFGAEGAAFSILISSSYLFFYKKYKCNKLF
ncbi:lipopolysaccharide biosynthesis protein [Desulforegula conservatrix]|uniref:lipopolysaccharide biosynthesis protein n=1 Tax=Desulforegula conservatrix TaxID=153026 RepID=UPI0003F6957B|nr:hypothetical protein [Desulforegula conservatrix]